MPLLAYDRYFNLRSLLSPSLSSWFVRARSDNKVSSMDIFILYIIYNFGIIFFFYKMIWANKEQKTL